ncbi:MAG: winged helix DNA-binding domain-containing protein [Acidimicrobiales bacterium]
MTDLVASRLYAQALGGPPLAGPVATCEQLLAIQAQDLRGARLATRVRTRDRAAADVDRALADRQLIVSWVNRGTLHLVRGEDWPWLHALTTPQLATSNARRLSQEGVTPGAADRGVAVVTRALTEEGPLVKADLAAHLERGGVPTAGQAFVHVLLRATILGLVVRGPVVGREQAFVLVREWLGEVPTLDRDVALAELARRYLRGHGPATARDLAAWAGITLGDARRGLAGVDVDELGDGLADLRGRLPAALLPGPRLLGPFDPLLHGWARRDWVLHDPRHVVTSNGSFRPSILVDGRIVGTWTSAGELRPFAPLDDRAAAALEEDLADVRRFVRPGR